jgi:NTP pyrophosphatase (non-canonical NTP hydrolase)
VKGKNNLEQLAQKVKKFVKDRDWEQYHSLKNLSMQVSLEASELMEIFLWTKTEDAQKRFKEKEQDVKDELADVLFGLLCFANTAGIDLAQAFEDKFKKTSAKYPVEKCKGKSLKYNEY